MIGWAVNTIGWVALYSCLAFVGVLIPLASAAAVYQEMKIWNPPKSLPSISVWGALKIWIFNMIWMLFTLVGSLMYVPLLLLRRLVSSKGNVEREAHCVVERYVARLVFNLCIGPVVVEGQEHLPTPQSHDEGLPSPFANMEEAAVSALKQQPIRTPACVYICNHASQLDTAAVYFLLRRFKWISKSSVRWLPGVGLVMALSRHVFIDRKRVKQNSKTQSSSSVSNLYKQANIAVQSGIPMLVFPQGTRKIAQKLPFKDGAFNIAMENNTTLVPVSIKIPFDVWNRLYPFVRRKDDEPIVLTVHPPIPVKRDANKEELKTKTLDIVYSALAPVPENGEEKKDK